MNIDEFLDSAVSSQGSGSSVEIQTPSSLELPSDFAEQVDTICTSISSYLENGDGQHALDLFVQLQAIMPIIAKSNKDQQNSLSVRILQTRDQLTKALVDLKQHFQTTSNQIYDLLTSAKHDIESGNVEHATVSYLTIRNLYQQLPHGFTEQKTAVQDDILKLFLYLKATRDAINHTRYAQSAAQIESLYVQALNAIQSGNIEAAHHIFDQMSGIYAGLPEGYVDRKSDLFTYLSTIHKQVTLLLDIQILQKEFMQVTQSAIRPQQTQTIQQQAPQSKIPVMFLGQKESAPEQKATISDSDAIQKLKLMSDSSAKPEIVTQAPIENPAINPTAQTAPTQVAPDAEQKELLQMQGRVKELHDQIHLLKTKVDGT